MAVPATYPATWDDQEFYPLHQEDDVPESIEHEASVRYARDAIGARYPDWFVSGNVCIYWEPGNTRDYRAPDMFVVREPVTEPVKRVYQLWKQPPVVFALEVGSLSTFRLDTGPKREIYQDLIKAREYFYLHEDHREKLGWRLGANGYESVALEANGRLRSVELELEFDLTDEGLLQIYTLDGEQLLDYKSLARQRAQTQQMLEVTEQRLEVTERQLAEADQRAEEEARLRQEAESERAREAQRRATAEARTAAEAERRTELERMLAELQAQLGGKQAGGG